jgi:hypothetical protein
MSCVRSPLFVWVGVFVDFSQERVDCARFLAGTLEDKVDCTFHFMTGDV